MKKDTRNIDKHLDRNAIDEDEIDLIEITKAVWANRKTVYKAILICFIIGLIVAFGSKVEYQAFCKLLPDAQDNKMSGLGGLGGLAGLAGINLDFGSPGTLSPELYPQIVQSFPFQLNVINTKLKFEKKDTIISSYLYFMEFDSPSLLGLIGGYTIGLPGKIKTLFSDEIEDKKEMIRADSGVIKLSREDNKFIEKFKERIEVEVDSKTGMITLTTKMPDPIAAAELAEVSVDLLQRHVINYKISKAQENLKFIKERHKEVKNRFEKAQMNLAAFNDRNQNVITARAQTEHQRLQNECNLAFEVYQGLATQLEQTEIKVKEDTPVFTMVEPVRVPVEKSTPKRKLILFISILAGFFLGVFYIALNYLRLKMRWSE